MTNRKSKWVIGMAGAACVVCCAIPLGGMALLAGGWATLVSFLTTAIILEILVCSIPLMVVGAGLLFISRQGKLRACCTAPRSDCDTTQCEIRSDKN